MWSKTEPYIMGATIRHLVKSDDDLTNQAANWAYGKRVKRTKALSTPLVLTGLVLMALGVGLFGAQLWVVVAFVSFFIGIPIAIVGLLLSNKSRKKAEEIARRQEGIIDGKFRYAFVTDNDFSFGVMPTDLLTSAAEQHTLLMAAFWRNDTVAHADTRLRMSEKNTREDPVLARQSRDDKLQIVSIAEDYYALSGYSIEDAEEHFAALKREAEARFRSVTDTVRSNLQRAEATV